MPHPSRINFCQPKALVHRGGIALLVGITPPGAQATLDTSLFIGSRSFTRASGGDCRPDRDFPLFVRWYREGKLKLDELVTRRSALEQINEAVDDLEHGRILGRAIITYTKPDCVFCFWRGFSDWCHPWLFQLSINCRSVALTCLNSCRVVFRYGNFVQLVNSRASSKFLKQNYLLHSSYAN